MRSCAALSGLFAFALALSSSGCMKLEEAEAMVDRRLFKQVGGTLFSTPDLFSMKEIHLDASRTKGKELILEGAVAESSEHGTYLVLKDDAARLLVVLTDIAGTTTTLAKIGAQKVKVWGTLETGKKGLPFLKAKALTLVP